MKTPKQLGYSTPPEWASVEAIWLSWPVEPNLWKQIPREEVEAAFSSLVASIARFAEVRLCVAPTEAERVSEQLGENAEIFAIETDDVWCRDHGPTFLINQESADVAFVDWNYNGWGGKFPCEKDALAAQVIGEAEGALAFSSKLTCEGGAIEGDGAGRVLTTESVLLNPNRNPDWTKEQVTSELCEMLGAEEVIWLSAGLDNDDTDGHIDMVARFVGPGKVLAVEPSNEGLRENVRRMEAAGLEVGYLPTVGEFSTGVDGSYANFLIVNDGVIVPQYGLPQDEQALLILQEAFSEKEIIPQDCRIIGLEGGGVHCLTQGLFRSMG